MALLLLVCMASSERVTVTGKGRITVIFTVNVTVTDMAMTRITARFKARGRIGI